MKKQKSNKKSGIIDQFSNSIISAEMAGNPSVMTAVGWSKDPKTGKMRQRQTASTNKLAENLGVISMFTDGPQGIIAPFKLGLKAIRHPIQTTKEIAKAIKSGINFVKRTKVAQSVSNAANKTVNSVKRSKISKQLTAPSRAKRIKKAVQESIKQRKILSDKYEKMSDKAQQISRQQKLKEDGSKSLLQKLDKTDIQKKRIIVKPNWRKIHKEQDVKKIMKNANIGYADQVKMGKAITDDGKTVDNVPYVKFRQESGYNSNNFVNSGDYEYPIFESGEIVKGSSHITNPIDVSEVTVRPTGFQNTTTTEKGNQITERVGFDKLRQAIKQNIEYRKKNIPGFKEFGSSSGMSGNAISHNTHDIDGYITKEALDEFMKNHNVSEKVKGETYLYKILNGKYGDAGDIDLNVINIANNGEIKNARTAEMYRQFFPIEYQKQAAIASTNPQSNPVLMALDQNGNIITSQQLIDAYDPLVKTIMDSIETNFNSAAKSKHAGRILEYLAGENPEAVSRALQQTSKLAGEKGHLLHKLKFGSQEENAKILERIGFKGDIYSVSNSPEKMQNVMDYWYLSGITNQRSVNAGNLNETGGTLEKLKRNLTDWNASGVNSGGYVSGAGLNTIQDGTPAIGSRSIFGMIQPEIKGLDKITDPNKIIDIINYTNGIKFTQDQAQRIFKKLNIKKQASGPTSGSEILANIPNSGEWIKQQLQELSDIFGINALRGKAYSGTYSGIIRQLNKSGDAIGTNAGDIFSGRLGEFHGLPSWTDRMTRVGMAGRNDPISSNVLFPQAYTKYKYQTQSIQDQFANLFYKKHTAFYPELSYTGYTARNLSNKVLGNYRKFGRTLGTIGAGGVSLLPFIMSTTNSTRHPNPKETNDYTNGIIRNFYGSKNDADQVTNDINYALRHQLNKLDSIDNYRAWNLAPFKDGYYSGYYNNIGEYNKANFTKELWNKIRHGSVGDADNLFDEFTYMK